MNKRWRFVSGEAVDGSDEVHGRIIPVGSHDTGCYPVGSPDDGAYLSIGGIARPEDFRLASAAPELVDALRLCYEHCRLYHRDVETNNVGSAVRAAIASATGEVV